MWSVRYLVIIVYTLHIVCDIMMLLPAYDVCAAVALAGEVKYFFVKKRQVVDGKDVASEDGDQPMYSPKPSPKTKSRSSFSFYMPESACADSDVPAQLDQVPPNVQVDATRLEVVGDAVPSTLSVTTHPGQYRGVPVPKFWTP